MFRHRQSVPSRLPRLRIAALAAACGLLTLAAVAAARSFTLHAGDAKVTNAQTGASSTERILLTRHGRAIYLLTGDSRHHPQCTSAVCLQFWPPVTVRSGHRPSAAPGLHGKLATWRHNGFTQVTLNGHPLYRFSEDSRAGRASGEGIKNFGGTWHVIKSGTQPKAAPAPAPMPAPPTGGY